jgi:hypothetical protein
MRLKFFTDRFPEQNIVNSIHWYPEVAATRMQLSPQFKRIWIVVDIPIDQELWPESFEGLKADVLEVSTEKKVPNE